ncbi:E3 ubiquitin-protein ligase RMA1H1-like [Lotus japonicus]|uniref:E3 ubiquitin-protein ligase RMA1H1-like n=1 Tax=Lotus japonicus TaxID=34305 RepID=UPI00258F323E|nr:E3 ubiquitin-protein ligase RMA1H1-like [Lotus japonicus]
MAFEHYLTQEWEGSETETVSCDGGFDCNICLEFAHEPVVTLCGHLYCWPCIYKWLYVQSASLAPDEPPQCPVCKDGISHTTMVPLYGRGPSDSNLKVQHKDVLIPPRPTCSGAKSLFAASSQSSGQQLPYRNPYQNQDFNQEEEHDDETSQQMVTNLGGATMATGFPHLVFGMFGVGSSANSYNNPNSPPRFRRLEMQADKSLNRISIFLLCCFLLCLIVF